MKTLLLLIQFTFLFAFFNCTLFKKSIDKPIIIVVPDKFLTVTINSTAYNTKYSNNLSKDGLSKHFFDGFEKEATVTTHVTLKTDDINPDFVIKVISLNINESSSTEKINDQKSPYNGQEIILNSVSCSVEVEIVDVKNKRKILKKCYNSKTKSEKVKTNRNIGDLISGGNKDRTTYRTKLLPDNICNDLCEDVGRRIWTPITRRIAKAMK